MNGVSAHALPLFFTLDDGSNASSVSILTLMLATLHNPQRRKFKVCVCKSSEEALQLGEHPQSIAVLDIPAPGGRFSPVLVSTIPANIKPAWVGRANKAILVRFKSDIRAIVAESSRQIPAIPSSQYGSYKYPLSSRPRHRFFKSDGFGEALEYVA